MAWSVVVAYQDATAHSLLLAKRSGSGNWSRDTIAGDEEPFAGGYGFYASGFYDGSDLVLSNLVLDQPNYDSWVEIHREKIVIE